MYFNATPLNMTTLLVVVIAVVALYFLFRGRHDSNLPLMFYSATLMLISLSDVTVNTYLLYAGLAFAMVLRFEFMGKGFTKFMNFLTSGTILLITLSFLDRIFGDGTMLS